MSQAPDFQNFVKQVQLNFNLLQTRVIRAQQAATSAQAELGLMRAGRTPRFPVEFTSQFGEDMLAWQLLGKPLDGFFIEAGAFDGYRYSVTYALEAMGWSGLLVEALPAPAELCRQRRTGSRVVHAGLSRDGASGTSTFTVTQDQYGGMLSYLKPTDQHVADTSWAQKTTIQVPVTSLNALLAEHNGPIDVVSIDVEGGEIDVLDGFDIERFKPRLMLLEDNTHGRDPALANYMSRFPYEMITRLAVNNVYIRHGENEVKERFKWMMM